MSPSLTKPEGVDLDVLYLQRTPMYNRHEVWYTSEGKPYLRPGTESDRRWPEEGELVTFTAHFANKGTLPSGPFSFRWTIDGLEVASGVHPGLDPAQEDTRSYTWPWAHTLEGERLIGGHTVGFEQAPPMDWSEDGGFHMTEDDRRGNAYYDPATDIDGALLHELTHQLGIIDMYALDVPLEVPQVLDRLGRPLQMEYWTGFLFPGLMSDPGIQPPMYDEHTALALNANKGYRRGYYGEYLYDVPRETGLRVLHSVLCLPPDRTSRTGPGPAGQSRRVGPPKRVRPAIPGIGRALPGHPWILRYPPRAIYSSGQGPPAESRAPGSRMTIPCCWPTLTAVSMAKVASRERQAEYPWCRVGMGRGP